MRHFANNRILNIKPYVPGKPIEEVKRELKLRRAVKLASNENPYGPSPKVLMAIRSAAKDLNRYPDGGCFYLRQELAKRLKVRENQLIFGNGSDEIIVFASRAFLKPGDEVIIAQPSFLIYDIASRVAGAKVKSVKLRNDFSYDLDRMADAVTAKTRIIFLGNPDNPSGQYFAENQMRSFLKKVGRNVVVFIDEAYFEYVRNKDYVDSVKLIKSHPNVIVTRTFSKMYGLAGLRVGYGIARPELVDVLNRVREPFNVNSLAQVAAIAALRDKSYYAKIARIMEKERQYLYRHLEKLKLDFVKSHANFILIDVRRDATGVTRRLMAKGLIVRDMSFWGMKNYIRVSIGKPEENRMLISTLEGVL